MIGQRSLLAAAIVAVLGSTTPSLAGAQPPQSAEAPDGVVRRLYREFAWEAVFSDPVVDHKWVGLLQQPPAVLERYFTPRLAHLLAKDADCARRSGEICRIDFLPIWASQDPGATDLMVSPAIGGVVQVGFKYPGNGKAVTLRYSLVRAVSGWRIADISSPSQGWSLLNLLSGN
jgi:hypothetical protein